MSARLVFLGVVLALLGLPAAAVLARVLSLPDGGLRITLLVAGAWGFGAFLVTLWAMIRRPRLRSPLWVAAITVPGWVWAAGTFLAIPWALVSWIPHVGALGWVPYALAATGVWTSFVPRREVVRIRLGEDGEGRVAAERTRVHELPTDGEGLRIVQITDPHLGAFRSEASLRALCERAVAAEPDLVLLTGDFFTMEGRRHPDALARALAPLRALSGRTFACLGNHDHEAPEAVASALADAGVRLLVDDAVTVGTRVGTVQIVGLDHRWSDRGRHAAVLAAHPRPAGALRVVLLHDPGAFRHLPAGDADLVLSGHTHGGHVGLVSLGLDWTAVRAIANMPDHGLWARGKDRLYVHRGSGHYGFPLRIGVPMEESVIEVVR